jgi:BCD family chlorophyll transporter-like MFS transporter
MVDPYTPAALVRAFLSVGGAALALGLLGLLRLEPRSGQDASARSAADSHSWIDLFGFIFENRQARVFFTYLVILLAALLGQDILLEPFAAEAFDMSVRLTTRITSIWGTCVLAALLIAGVLEGRVSKRKVAVIGGWGALIGFALIAVSGLLTSEGVFYAGIVLLGVGTGLSTVSNLSLMLDMTTADKVGLFVGAWGMGNAISRLIGSVLGAIGRDAVAVVTGSPVIGYTFVFTVMTVIMLVSLLLLRTIDVEAFRRQAEEQIPLVERVAMASDAG